jgi:hypothetical protein
LFIVWVIFFIQARHGTYTSFSQDKPFVPIFAGFGGWVLNIFDAVLDSGDDSSNTNTSEQNK